MVSPTDAGVLLLHARRALAYRQTTPGAARCFSRMNCHFFVVQGSQASKYGDGLRLPLAMGGVSRDNLGDARLDARVPGLVFLLSSLKAVAKPKPPCIAACAEYGLGKNKEVSTRHGLAVDLRTWERDLSLAQGEADTPLK